MFIKDNPMAWHRNSNKKKMYDYLLKECYYLHKIVQEEGSQFIADLITELRWSKNRSNEVLNSSITKT